MCVRACYVVTIAEIAVYVRGQGWGQAGNTSERRHVGMWRDLVFAILAPAWSYILKINILVDTLTV